MYIPTRWISILSGGTDVILITFLHMRYEPTLRQSQLQDKMTYEQMVGWMSLGLVQASFYTSVVASHLSSLDYAS